MDNLLLLLALALGMQIGYFAQDVHKRLKDIQAQHKEKEAYAKSGVVRPEVRSIPRVDLTSPTGGVRRPTPDEYLLANMKERDAKLKKM